MIITVEKLKPLITAPMLADAIDCAITDGNDFTIKLTKSDKEDQITAEFICGIGYFSCDVPTSSVASAIAVAIRTGSVTISSTVCADPTKIEITGLSETQMAFLRPRTAATQNAAPVKAFKRKTPKRHTRFQEENAEDYSY